MPDYVPWLIAAVVLLLVALVIAAVMRNRKAKEAARVEAGRLRERASAGHHTVEQVETTARDTRTEAEVAAAEAEQAESEAQAAQAQAERARQEAEQLQARADAATEQARQEHDRVTDDYLRADEVDPDKR